MWKRINVELQVTNRLMAGIPKNPDLIQAWLEARAPTDKRFQTRKDSGEQMTSIATLTETVAEEVDSTGGEEEKAWLGFKTTGEEEDMARQLYIEGSNVKAHLKDCANILQKFLELKALRAKLADRVYVEDERVYLGVSAPDGVYEHPVHVMTRQGPRSALKRNDYVEKPLLKFTLKVLEDDIIDEDLLKEIFAYGAVHGIGAERGLGYGRYLVERFEQA